MIQLDDVKSVLASADDETLTLYLNVDATASGNISSNPGWSKWVRNTLREVEDIQEGDDKTTWKGVRERAEQFFSNYQPTGKGLALLVGPNFERSFEFPFPMDNYASYGKPHVMPLLWAIDEYEPYLIALVDQTEARFFVSYLGSADFQPGTTLKLDFGVDDFGEKTARVAPQTGEYVTRGSPRDQFADFVEEHVAQLHRKVADQIEKLMNEYGARRIILGGNEQAAHHVRNLLPKRLVDAVVAVLPIPILTYTQEMLPLVQPHALEYERQEEVKLVEEVIDFAKKGGRGALGWDDVRRALDMGQVELLILPWPLADEAQATELAVKAFASNGKVELVHGEAAAALGGEGGLAARLYYAL